MPQYCVYTQDPEFYTVLKWLDSRNIEYDVHLNRTRFSLVDSALLTEFLVKWGDRCPRVDPRQNLATGFAETWDLDSQD